MRNIYEYSNDSAFLKQIDTSKNQTQYLKVTLLNWNEEPLQEIQGIITSGNISINGSSSVRRACNFSIFVDNDDYQGINDLDYIISINKKIYLEVGLKNTTNKYTQYDIIWFPLGLYIMRSPSISYSTSGITMSAQCQDKMCLLNGDVGGTIPASTQFDEEDTVDENGEWVIAYPTIVEIIRECVHHFGGEQLGKIIISDIDSRIKKVMKWTGSNPVYLVDSLDTTTQQHSYSLTTNCESAPAAATVTEYTYGDDIGYIYTDFIYTSELIANAGDSVCTILDKIKNYLGNFEYFYDIDGNFVFQEIKNFLNTTQAKVELKNLTKDDYLLDMSKGKSVYTFSNGDLVTSFSSSPQFDKIRNDFIVWGIRENANGNDVPVRYHLSIDAKPEIGNTYKCFFYTDPDDNLTKVKVPIVFETKAEMEANDGVVDVFYYAKDTNKVYKWYKKAYTEIDVTLTDVTTKDWRNELYLQGAAAEPLGIDSNYYYTELNAEWPKLYDVENGEFYQAGLDYPTDLDYYLDFIDSDAAISRFNISSIGRRTEIISDNDINCLFEPEIPDFVLIQKDQDDTAEKRTECENQGQAYIQVDTSIYSLIVGGGNHNAALDRIKEMLYEDTSYNESISIQSIPVYHLDVNTRITVEDIKNKISGDYIVNSISLPLDDGDTMSISAQKALQKL